LQTTTSAFEETVAALSRVAGVETIVLFGSHAAFKERRTSDIDLLLIFKKDGDARSGDAAAIRIASQYSERFISVTSKSRSELERDPAFASSIFAQGLVLYQAPTSRERAFSASALLDAKPFVLYSTRSCSGSSRHKISRVLRGYKKGTYTYKGIVERLGGRILGPSTFLIPQEACRELEKSLLELGLKFERIQVYVPAFQALP